MTERDVTPGGDAFMSTFTPRLDDKGRLFLPAKWRETLGERVVLTKGADRCVTGYSAAGFNAHVSARLRRAPTSSRAVRDLRRALMGAAEPNKPDGQGRITIPLRLRQYAGLDKDCVVVGAGDYFEIWEAGAYDDIERAGNDTLNRLDGDEGVAF